MFLEILRILSSNVLKTFLNIVVSIACTFVIFHKCFAGWQESNTMINKNDFKTDLYMHNIIGRAMFRESTWVNFCLVCAAGLWPVIDPILVTFGQMVNV